jgi:hypothetical protein
MFTVANLVGAVNARLVNVNGSAGASITLVNGLNTIPYIESLADGPYVELSWSAASSGDITDLRFVTLGCISEMDPNWNGLGPNYPDSSGAARDWVLPTSGAPAAITRDIIGQRVNIRGSILHSAISSLAGTTLLTALPAGWVPVEFQANVSEGFGTGITLSIGTSGTPAAVVSALDVSTIALVQADSLKRVPFSLTAATNLYFKKSASTTTGALLVYTLTLEKKY